ncbi:MAG: ParB/RepB/Spo0J family partition protein [Bacteroidales bacterium]|jgi:ParB family chromosome partitioning protein|nr:ParB/RepB/Spo0J family partition protein [Bacteroidales bacterium]
MAKKVALGRGLGALLQNMEGQELTNNTKSIAAEIANVPIDAIEPNPNQPRTEFDENTLKELAQSIKQYGIIVPVTVNKIGGRYQLIAGERRYRAAKLAGLKEIPAYIRIVTKHEIMEMALVENIQRQDLNPIETSLTLQALIDECNFTQEQMSERIGKSRSTITNFLRLLKLPAEVQLNLRNGIITMGHARALIGLEKQEQQLQIMKSIIEKDLSVRQVEAMVNHIKNPQLQKKTPAKPKKKLPEFHTDFKKSISSKLGSSVDITRSIRGKGSIVIPFSDDKDFERIVAIIEGVS